jgi:hypothetical protein
MRPPVDAEAVRTFARALGGEARVRMTMYLTGGATAVLSNWRETTVDVDMRLEPEEESDVLLRHVPALKERLGVNVELVSPSDFIPELPGWRERSPFLFSEGLLDVRNYDPYSQALCKLERAFAHDLADVDSMLRSHMIDRSRALELFRTIEPLLFRYPAIDPGSFRARVERTLR